MAAFSLFVSGVFGGLMREDGREQLTLAAKMFGAMMAAAIAIGWLMLPFPI
jgi:hypothetical protein